MTISTYKNIVLYFYYYINVPEVLNVHMNEIYKKINYN